MGVSLLSCSGGDGGFVGGNEECEGVEVRGEASLWM